MADQTESSIESNATPAQSMDVIADLPAYPKWSEGSTSVEVLSIYEDDGRPADARFHIDSGPIRDDYELEYDWNGDTEVTWKLTKGDMVTAMDGMYLLTVSGDSTTVLYRLAVDVKIPMLGMIKRKAEKVIVDTALKGLKDRVESGAAR